MQPNIRLKQPSKTPVCRLSWSGAVQAKSQNSLRNVWMCSHLEWACYTFLSPSMSPCRSWVQRKSTTCWWPPALIRSWKLSGKSFTTACWRPETWTVSSPQVHSFLVLQTHANRNTAHIGSLLQKKTWSIICFFNKKPPADWRLLLLLLLDVNEYESRLSNCVLHFVTLTVFIRKTLGVSFGCNTRTFLTSLPCWNRVMHIQSAWLLKQTQRLRWHHTDTESLYYCSEYHIVILSDL